MTNTSASALAQFKNLVGIKFQLYNSLFTSLPFHRIEKTGILLSLLLSNCEDGYKNNQSPVQILEDFFSRHTTCTKAEEKLDLLFRLVQYIERQVVLFDALEDAAFSEVNDMNGAGTLKHLESEVSKAGNQEALAEKLKDFAVKLVLTAHPTQFYPGSVLGIINDLSKALKENKTDQVNMYLQQLGKTPFFSHEKPTPYDEAISLIWYLENVFYPSAGRILSMLKNRFPEIMSEENPVLKMGFWPGGDRDGNPFVNATITAKVADELRGSIIKCYYLEIRRLKRRLTFRGVDVLLTGLEKKLYNNIFIPGLKTDLTKAEILETLQKIRSILVYQHNSLFLHLIDTLINKVHVFGIHFATLDIRQDSSVHEKVLRGIQNKRGASVFKLIPAYPEDDQEDDVADDALIDDTLETLRIVKEIQRANGEEGCNRYIISQCNSVNDVLEVFELCLQSGWQPEELRIDIIPLFETIDDLRNAASIMKELYNHDLYREHLRKRKNDQTIMLGFSDGTKDGGYLMANWSIYKAKMELTAISEAMGIEVIFFDGRGGPPARGGGKTHKFYASLGQKISSKEIQLTIQGQTVSSNFGTVDSARFNIEQLINAGISNDLFPNLLTNLNEEEEALMEELSAAGYEAYGKLKTHPYFYEYILQASPLRFYSETNIGSRPSKRNTSGTVNLKNLRAIPYVGAWSQIKQNVTGYFGVGTALKKMDDQGKLSDVKKLYRESLFFKTLIDNCEMAMMKTYLPLTAFFQEHERLGEIWRMIHSEYELTRNYLMKLTGQSELMSSYPVDMLSIQMRERIVLPLATIQQYAITRVRELDEKLVQTPLKKTYEKLVMRSSFGLINAGRNSA